MSRNKYTLAFNTKAALILDTINDLGEIMSHLLSDELYQTIKNDSPDYIRIFPGAIENG